MRELKLDKACLERLSEVLAFVDGILEELGCPMKIQVQLDIIQGYVQRSPEDSRASPRTRRPPSVVCLSALR